MLFPTLEMYIKEFVSVETLISYPMSTKCQVELYTGQHEGVYDATALGCVLCQTLL